jgi:hypothetical protein
MKSVRAREILPLIKDILENYVVENPLPIITTTKRLGEKLEGVI